MSDVYLIQLIGLLIAAAGVIALLATTSLYGTPLTRDEKRRQGDIKGNLYRLPFNLETIASALFFLGGVGILTGSKFNLCAFLIHWLPNLPEAFRIFLACR